MPDKDINVNVKAYTDQAKKQMDDFARSAKNVGDQAKQGGQQGSDGMDKLATSARNTESVFSKLLTNLKGWVAGLAAIGTAVKVVTAVIRENQRAIEEHSKVASEHQNKLARLQYLGDFFKEEPELLKKVGAYAEYGRREFTEVAGAWYNLRSKSSSLSRNTQDKILFEALEMGRTDSEIPLETLVDMFTLYAKKSGVQDANQIQNVLSETITQAGGGGADVARYMPRFLSSGIAGGLSPAQASGLWAYATTLTSDAAVATTGLNAAFLGLQGKGTPQGAEILQSLGIDPSMGFFQKMGILSQAKASGNFNLGMAEQLAGREGSSLLIDLLNDPSAMIKTINAVTGVNRGDIDLTGDKIQQLLSTDEIAFLEEEIRRNQIGTENAKATDINALRWKRFETASMKNAEEKGFSARQRLMEKFYIKAAQGLGFDAPEMSAQPIIYNDNSTNYQPRTGPDVKGPRVEPD